MNRGKIYERFPTFYKILQYAIIFSINASILIGKTIAIFYVGFGAEDPVAFREDQIEVRTPTVHNGRPVGYHQNLLEAHLLHQRIGCDGLAETHFAVPEHPVSGFEDLFGLVDTLLLFLAESNLRLCFGQRFHLCKQRGLDRFPLFRRRQNVAALLHGFDRSNGGAERNLIPFACLVGIVEFADNIAGVIQNRMNVVIAEGRAFYRAVGQLDLFSGKLL